MCVVSMIGDHYLTLDFICILMRSVGVDVGAELDGQRPHLEFIMTPEVEARLRSAALPLCGAPAPDATPWGLRSVGEVGR